MKKITVDDTFTLTVFENNPGSSRVICIMTVETQPYTDEYCYHEAPYSVDIKMSLAELNTLRRKIDLAIVLMDVTLPD